MAMPRNHKTGATRKQSVQHMEKPPPRAPQSPDGRPVLIVADPPMIAEAFLKEYGAGRGLTTWRDKIFQEREDRTMVWDEIIPLDVLTRELYAWLTTCWRGTGHGKVLPFGQPKALTVSNIIRHLRCTLPYLSHGPRCRLLTQSEQAARRARAA